MAGKLKKSERRQCNVSTALSEKELEIFDRYCTEHGTSRCFLIRKLIGELVGFDYRAGITKAEERIEKEIKRSN